METTISMVEITVKPEPIECENGEENEQNGIKREKEDKEELWIKTEPLEDESQDSIKDDDQGTMSENEARLDEEALNDECNRNRQSNAPSRKQILVFLDFLNEHRDLANCMLRGPTGRAKAHYLWEGIAERLNNISGCTKTTQQWQRVWSDKKYLTRKAAAARYASLSVGGPSAPELTLQDEKILAIIGEPIPPRRVTQKPTTPEPKLQTPKQPQDVLAVPLPPKRGPATVELEPQPVLTVVPQPEVPQSPNLLRKPYTPRKTEFSRKAEVPQQPDVPPSPAIPLEDTQRQADASKPPDDPPKTVQKQENQPLPPSISDSLSPSPLQPELNRQDRLRLRACLDPYTKKFIHLEEERLKSDARRNTELSQIRHSLQQGTAELAGIRNVMQEMLGLMKRMTERDDK